MTSAQKAGSLELANLGKHHWAVSMQKFLPIGAQLTAQQREPANLLFCGEGCAAIIDSGTSVIAAPSHALQAMGTLLPLAHDCSNWDTMPDLEFTLNGHRVRLPKESYAFKLSGSLKAKRAIASLLYFKPSITFSDVCSLNFVEIDKSTQFGPLWILGMPFFREYHVTFRVHEDVDKRRILLSRASASCHPEPLPEGVQSKEWNLKDALYKEPPVYPWMTVAELGTQVQHASTATQAGRSSGPPSVRAEDLLATGLASRLHGWRAMEAL